MLGLSLMSGTRMYTRFATNWLV